MPIRDLGGGIAVPPDDDPKVSLEQSTRYATVILHLVNTDYLMERTHENNLQFCQLSGDWQL